MARSADYGTPEGNFFLPPLSFRLKDQAGKVRLYVGGCDCGLDISRSVFSALWLPLIFIRSLLDRVGPFLPVPICDVRYYEFVPRQKLIQHPDTELNRFFAIHCV